MEGLSCRDRFHCNCLACVCDWQSHPALYLFPTPMAAIVFTPTIASIPPSNALLRLREIPGALPNLHPLVILF